LLVNLCGIKLLDGGERGVSKSADPRGFNKEVQLPSIAMANSQLPHSISLPACASRLFIPKSLTYCKPAPYTCSPHANFLSQTPAMSSSSPLSSPIMPDPSNITNSSQPTTMAPRDRSGGREVHIYDAKEPATVIGGLILTNGVTNANLYSMVEILVLFTSAFELQDKDETKIQRNDDPLQPGKYYINTAGKFLYRIISSSANFGVMDRDLRDQ
jgi:hypothetical protein